VEQFEFAMPPVIDAESWARSQAELRRTHDEIGNAIQDETKDISRILYHLIHDGYHLGRITQLRGVRGTPPKF